MKHQTDLEKDPNQQSRSHFRKVVFGFAIQAKEPTYNVLPVSNLFELVQLNQNFHCDPKNISKMSTHLQYAYLTYFTV